MTPAPTQIVVPDPAGLSPTLTDEPTPWPARLPMHPRLPAERAGDVDYFTGATCDETTALLPGAEGDSKPSKPSPGEPAKPTPFLGGVSPGRFWVIFSGILFTYFVVIFDATILSSSHPVITSYFGASQSASWLSTAYLLTSTSLQPLVGRISDSTGRKLPFVLSLVVFTVATLACALAPTIGALIAARAICGLGGGGMIGMASICVGDLVPIERRGPYQSTMSVMFGVSSMAGAALGGLMADHLGWRWEFGVQVPILLLSLGVIMMALPENLGLYGKQRESLQECLRSFDFKGSLLLTLTVTFLILGLDIGGNLLPWSHPLIIASLVLALFFFPLFLRAESLAEKPVMPLDLVCKAPVMNLIFSHHLASFLTNAILFNVPLFFQAVLLTSATDSGLRLAVPSMISSIAGVATGFLITYTRDLKWAPLVGSFLFLGGVGLLSAMRAGLPDYVYLLCLVPSSLGQGLQFPGTFLAVLGVTEQRDVAVVTTTLQLWRSLGAVAGIAGSSIVVQSALASFLDANVSAGDAEKAEILRAVKSSVGAVASLPEPYRSQVMRSYESALSLMFGCCVGLAMISLLLLMPIQLPKLKPKEDASQDAAEEPAA
ncbi:hypothetical protein PpBr36_00937 [Pyricularia pennisetigena]|uniref:hypothetical protein n=1 Tax=Pyricularia pennisetigena TaxID=1578925 RepID=UPI001154A14A|nr:hypothetical protein PpBr36_00937 [Pyricularia pennisetigena]TLS28161.1 hypothetical protein PpBr36_00937 [Pyricularia pennisetigena]